MKDMSKKSQQPDRIEYGFDEPQQDEGAVFWRKRWYGKHYRRDDLTEEEVVKLLNEGESLKIKTMEAVVEILENL